MNYLKNFFSKINANEKKIIYLIYFLPIALLMGSLIINLTIFLICIFFIYELIIKKKIKKILNIYTYFFLIIFIYLILNSVFIGKNIDGLIRAIGFLRFIILAIAIAYYLNIENRKYEKKILYFWSIIFIFVSLDLLFEFVFGFNTLNFKSDYPGRLAGFTGDELKIGGFYFGFILLSLTYIKYNKSNLFVFSLIVFFVIAYLIGERSNFIKILLMILPFYFILYNSNVFKKIFYLSIPVIIILLITITDAKFKQRFFYYFINPIIKNNLEESLSKDKHISHYRLAIDIFKNNKLFGVGIKNFRHESYHRSVNLGHKIAVTTHPHQIHLEFLSELGIVGYILLMSFLFYTIFNGFLIYRTKNDIAALSATLFIIATILPILPSGSFFTTYGATIFWINFSFICRHNYNYNK